MSEIARLADGTILRFPDGTDPAVMDMAVAKHISEQSPVIDSSLDNRPNFAERMEQNFNERMVLRDEILALTQMPEGAPITTEETTVNGGGIMNALKNTFSGPSEEEIAYRERANRSIDSGMSGVTNSGLQTPAEGALQLTGKVGAGLALDAIGEGLVSTARGLSNITPDFIEEPLTDFAKEQFTIFMDRPLMQMGLEALKTGGDKWGAWSADNPRAARNIESVVDIGLIAAPIKGKPKVATSPSVLERGAAALETKAVEQVSSTKQDFLTQLVRPKQTPSVKLSQAGRTTEEGIFRNKVIAPSAEEIKIAQSIDGIKGVSPRNTLTGNRNIIEAEIGVEANILKESLKDSPYIFTTKEIDDAFAISIKNLESAPLIVGDAAKVGERLISKAKEIVAQNPKTSSGLLRSRQEFDRYVRSQKPKAFDEALDNALTTSVREVRTTLNNLVIQKNPSKKVKESLSRQFNLYSAVDNISTKAAAELNNAVTRSLDKVMKIIPLRNVFSSLGGLALGLGGLQAAQMFAAPFLLLAKVGAGAYVGNKILLSPQAKRALSGLLRTTDKAIKMSKDKQVIKQLRADRVLIAEALKEGSK
tara:strand:- start:43 stop:1815 length:1773 start_codon:yes stop_codon:yes gene_type:complete